MRLIAAGMLLLAVTFTAEAETKRVCWVNATQNTDGSSIPATGSGALDRTYVQYGTRSGTDFGTVQGRVSVAAPANCLDLSLVVVQEFALRAFHCNTFHTETTTADAGKAGCSDFSNVALTEVLPANPQPPASLTVQEDTTAYVIVKSRNRVALVPVGTTAEGVECDASQSILGKFVIPRESVTWASSTRDEVVVASCG